MVYSNCARGARISEAIQRSGKRQNKVAELIGVTPQSITKWIKTGKIRMDNMHALAQVTGVDVHYLVSGSHASNIAEPGKKYRICHQELYELIEKLDDQQAKKLVLCAKVLQDHNGDAQVSISIGGKPALLPEQPSLSGKSD